MTRAEKAFMQYMLGLDRSYWWKCDPSERKKAQSRLVRKGYIKLGREKWAANYGRNTEKTTSKGRRAMKRIVNVPV